jgi:hypothetical protein
MPLNPYALNGLQQALGTPIPGSELLSQDEVSSLGPAGADYLFKTRLKDELQDRLNREQMAGPAPAVTGTPLSPSAITTTGDPGYAGRLAALKSMLGQTSEDIGDPGTTPTTPLGIQRQGITAQDAANRAALQAGFPSSQEQALYARQMAAKAAEQPLKIEQLKGEAQVEAARQQGLGAEQSREHAGSDFINLMKQAYPQGIPPGTEIRAPGGIEIRTQTGAQTLPAQAEKDITLLESQRPNVYLRAIPAFARINADIDRKISEIKTRYGVATPTPVPSGGSTAGPDALRQQAISELQAAGHPATEANIQYTITQLSRQGRQ